MNSIRFLHRKPFVVFMSTVLLFMAVVIIARYYFNPGTITLPSGKIVPRLSVAEAGPLAADEFLPQQQTYLTSTYGEYSVMAFQPATTAVQDTASRVKELLKVKFAEDQERKTLVAKLPPEALDDLSYRVALVYARASGMALSDYKAHLTSDDIVVAPQFVMEQERTIIANMTPAQAFESLYNTADAQSQRVKSWALSQEGTRVALKCLPFNEIDGVLLGSLPEGSTDYRLFHGDVTKGSLVLHQSSQFEKLQTQRQLCFEISMIVEDIRGDRYPLSARLFYDSGAKRWWLWNACRMASLKATNQPRLVF